MTLADHAAVRGAKEAVRRDDLDLDVARPDQYDEVEALSCRAPAADVTSPLTVALMTWFADRHPGGRGFVVLARDRTTRDLAGHFVFYPWRLERRFGNGAVSDLRTLLYVRLYVRPDCRRRGVFAAMTTFGLDVAGRLGVGMAYTAPNPRSSAGFVKFGMTRRGPLPFLVRPMLPGWRWLGGPGVRDRRLDIERRDGFDETFAGVAAATLPASTTCWGGRRAAELNWRFVQRPDAEYAIRYIRRGDDPVGYLVTRRMVIGRRRVLVVVDAWADAAWPSAIRVALDDDLRSGAAVDLAMAIGSTAAPAYRRACRRAGFVRVPTWLLPQPVVIFGGGVGDDRQRVPLPPLDAWHLTPCDWDVF